MFGWLKRNKDSVYDFTYYHDSDSISRKYTCVAPNWVEAVNMFMENNHGDDITIYDVEVREIKG